MPDKLPSKKPDKKTPSKKKASKKATAKKVNGKNKEELKTLRKILKQSHQHDAIGHAIDLMQENLNSYILLGYSFDGVPITAVAAKTPQEYDALYSRAMQFVQQNGNIQSPRGQEEEYE